MRAMLAVTYSSTFAAFFFFAFFAFFLLDASEDAFARDASSSFALFSSKWSGMPSPSSSLS